MYEARFPGHRLLPYALVFPSVAVIVVFLVVPFVQSVRTSFFRASPFGTKVMYVGWDNYARLFSSPDYVHSLLITLVFSAFVILVGLSVSLAIAMLANQRIRGKGFYQVALIWTYALSPAVAGTIWALMFAPATGIMPYLIAKLTGLRFNWMTNGTAALLIVSAAATWKMLGYNIVFFIAGLQNVPGELIEAARVDGAGPMRYLLQILVPISKTNIAALFVIEFIFMWSQYLWPLIVTTTAEMRVVQIGLKMLLASEQIAPEWNIIMAGTVIAMLPPLVVLILFRHSFAQGIAMQSQK